MRGHKIRVEQLLPDDHMHHGQGQRGVRARADQHHRIGLGGGLCPPNIDDLERFRLTLTHSHRQ